jgi:peptide/nickel transport system permease protein
MSKRKRAKRSGFFVEGCVILVFFGAVALLAPVISPYDPNELGIPYLAPSADHFLGTNDVGQDIFSEIIYGTRVSLIIGVVSALVVTVIGTSVGLVSGYFGGITDKVSMELTSVAMAVPALPVTILLLPTSNRASGI